MLNMTNQGKANQNHNKELESLCSADRNKNGAATMLNSAAIPQKLKIESPYDPETSLLGMCPKELKAVICTVMFTKITRQKQPKYRAMND